MGISVGRQWPLRRLRQALSATLARWRFGTRIQRAATKGNPSHSRWATGAGRLCVVDGLPQQQPTYSSGVKADGKEKKKGKSATCFFCQHVHSLDTIKSKGEVGEYEDVLLVVADFDREGGTFFRLPKPQGDYGRNFRVAGSELWVAVSSGSE